MVSSVEQDPKEKDDDDDHHDKGLVRAELQRDEHQLYLDRPRPARRWSRSHRGKGPQPLSQSACRFVPKPEHHILRSLSLDQLEIQVGQVGQLSPKELPNEIVVDPHFVLVQSHRRVRQPLARSGISAARLPSLTKAECCG